MKKTETTSQSFDFDYWSELAKKDPQRFEEERRQALDAVIGSASDDMQPRLRGLQWRIDMERRRAKTPMASCLKIYNMMWNSVYGEGGLLESMDGLLGASGKKAVRSLPISKPTQSADVLTFRASNS